MLETLQQLWISICQLFLMLLNPVFLIPIVVVIFIYIKKRKDYKACAYYQITKVPYSSLKRDKGRYGEYLTYKNLQDFENDGAKFLFNVYLPKENGKTTEIDVLMLSKKGIFVLESKNYSGWIFGNEKQKYWYQTLPAGGGTSHKEPFYNPILQNRSHIKHLKVFVGEQIATHSIIVFSQRCTLKNIEVSSNDISVIHRDEVAFVVSSIYESTTEDILTESDIMILYNKLYPLTQISDAVKAQHITDIQNQFTRKPVTVAPELNVSSQTECEETYIVEPFSSEQISNDSVEIDEVQKDIVETQIIESDSIKSIESNMNDLPNHKCPRCGGNLVLKTAHRGANAGNQFWGCSNYPKCKYIKNVTETENK